MQAGARAAVLAAGLSLSLPAALPAQADRWERQVAAGLTRAADLLAERGYRPAGDGALGLLFTEESQAVPLSLVAGREYAVIAVCDEDCGTLHLVLSRRGGYEVDADRGRGNVPVTRVVPERSGEYLARVVMAGCRESPCRFGLRAFAREPRPD